MHGFTVLSLFTTTALVAAQQEIYFLPLVTYNNQLAARQQNCASVGEKPCGVYCMLLTDTCCGNGAGACHLGTVCGLADNGIYGCCPIGRNCRGNAPDPSVTTKIGSPRPTSTISTSNDGPTSITSTSTKALTTTSASSRGFTSVFSSTSSSTVVTGGSADSSTNTIPQPTSGSGSGSSGGDGSNGGNNNGNGIVTASAGMARISLVTLAGGFIAAVASLL
ncbi:hypothetical protein NQ176_g9202 [Zarea fungicola]|uniref:Uncharacterized protein n=1 Tax=Zarea fungicola TaxID=93591 RepID=A0ACC1MN26_9HYPO|nr:hypothetical protein NQ176_g9202 [Lecanicillium fungicola]